MAVYTLYLLESTYRFAEKYQKKIGRLCFLSLGILTAHQIFSLWKNPIIQFYTSTVYGHSFSNLRGNLPCGPTGIPTLSPGGREKFLYLEMRYTPQQRCFLTGASFLGVALTVFVFRWLKLDFTYFENFLLIFSLCFFSYTDSSDQELCAKK